MPIQNIGMMMDIYHRIGVQISEGGKITRMQNCLEKLTEIVQKVYKDTEDYYKVTSENEKSYQVDYAEIFEGFIAALDMKEVSGGYWAVRIASDFDFDIDIY